VRREHDADDPRRAARQSRLDRLRDPRLPVLHADEDRHVEFPLQRGPLCLGHAVERRAPADAPVAFGQLRDCLVRDRAPAAHVLEVLAHVLGPRRAAVRHQHDRVHASLSTPSYRPVISDGQTGRARVS
jgi:hypothetical protein